MKTTALKWICSALFLPLLLSSCLGDGDSSYTVENDFGYVSTLEVEGLGYIKCAAVYGGGYGLYISNDDIKGLQENECYRMNYVIPDMSNTSYGIHSANTMGTASFKQIPQYAAKVVAYIPENETKAFYLTDSGFAVSMRSPNDFFGNRWAFEYRGVMKEGDDIRPYFYFDESNQREYINGDWQPLASNRMIIDVRFEKESEGIGTAKVDKKEIVGNLSEIKSYFEGSVDFGSSNAVYVGIKFRYIRKSSETSEPEQIYIGDWASGSDIPTYAFAYTKE